MGDPKLRFLWECLGFCRRTEEEGAAAVAAAVPSPLWRSIDPFHLSARDFCKQKREC